MSSADSQPHDLRVTAGPLQIDIAVGCIRAQSFHEVGLRSDGRATAVIRRSVAGDIPCRVMGCRGDERGGIEIEQDLHRREHEEEEDEKPTRGPDRARAPLSRHGVPEPIVPTSRSMLASAAADRLGITSRTLYRFIDEGQLPAFKFGRVIRLKKADVDAYIESCRVEPGSMSHLYPETSGN